MTKRKNGRNGILVIQSMGIGDVVFTIPVLNVLKRHFPDDPITFLTNEENAELLSLVPEVQQVISYRRKTPAVLLRLLREVRRHKYQMAVVLNPLFRGGLLAWCSGAPVRVGYRRDFEGKQSLKGLVHLLLTHSFLPRNEKLHEVERYLDLLRMFGLGVLEEERVPRLVLPENAREFGRLIVQEINGSHQGPLVAINPGAGWELKQWPEGRFIEVADWLVEEYNARIIFVGGRKENTLVQRILTKMHRAAESYVGRTTLLQLSGLLSASDLLLTNDTGAMHIAAALDVPTVALFGPGDPVKVRPLSRNAVVLYDQVPCSPCQVQYTDKCQDNICMQAISIDAVRAAVSAILGGRKRTTDRAAAGIVLSSNRASFGH